MQAIEKDSDAGGHSYAAMMECAGRAVAETILARFGKQPGSKQPGSKQGVLVLAGPGNNGGDGLVCARYLHEAGATVFVYLWKRRTDPANDYEGHFARLVDLGVVSARAEEDSGLATLSAWLAQSSMVVDALLGTGANRPIEGLLAELLDVVAAQRDELAVVAVDCASGLDCDTGALSSHAIRPEITVTFGFAKVGHYQFPGAEAVGELVVADIGLADTAAEGLRTFLITPELVRSWMPKRPRLSHKGTFGKVLLAVGSESFPGAAYLSCAAAGRAGAGLVTGAVPRPIWPLVAGRLAEPTWLPLPVQPELLMRPGNQSPSHDETQEGDKVVGWLEPSAGSLVVASVADYTAFVLGCGMGNNKATRRFVGQLLRHPLPPSVIDADGLNCMAALDNWPAHLPAKCVLTPHPAEMARLCQIEVGEVVARRWELARQKAAEWRCVILLKGPYTVVAHPDGWLGVLPIATPALATAGSGDVLAGTLGGLLAQGLEPLAAACVGAWLHGTAGLACEREIGPAGVVASDLLARLPVVLRELHGGGVSKDVTSSA